jgi:hypothetical protein
LTSEISSQHNTNFDDNSTLETAKKNPIFQPDTGIVLVWCLRIAVAYSKLLELAGLEKKIPSKMGC